MKKNRDHENRNPRFLDMPHINTELISPGVLESELKDEEDIGRKIKRVADAMIAVLKQIGNRDDAVRVRNIVLTLLNQEEIYLRLFDIYKETFVIHTRLSVLLNQKEFKPEDRQIIQKRATEIVNDQIFTLQRDVFFKIVNAKEVAEGDNDEDGPALLFPGIEKTKNEIVRGIQSQTQKLKPAAVDICKTFTGIADDYVDTEDRQVNEKVNYDTIYQSYELEKQIRTEISGGISALKLDEHSYLDEVIKRFETLRKTYQLKIKSLRDKQPDKVLRFEQKVEILKLGVENVNRRLRPLKVLKNLSSKLPTLEKQMDLFAESYYQAKAVMNFLNEVNEEMSHVFTQHNLKSFTVVSLLRYKLNGTSHMYESIHYYYATIQIEEDIQAALIRRFEESSQTKMGPELLGDRHKVESGKIALEMHRYVAKMNECNYKIHVAFLEYKRNPDLEVLRGALKTQTALINKLRSMVKLIYKRVQQLFFSFLSEDLGASEITFQLGNYLRLRRDITASFEVKKGFNNLLSTRRKQIETFERDFLERFGDKINKKKAQAMAMLKVKTDLQRELLSKIQKCQSVQPQFIYLLKELIKVHDEHTPLKTEASFLMSIKEKFAKELKLFREEDLKIVKQLSGKTELSERDAIVAFVGSNITTQEIESFSRLLPGLPRNEFQLDTPYGRLLLDIKTMHKDITRFKSASGNFILEKVFEKRERQKLISNINQFFYECMEPFFKKIDNEEKKIDTMIDLERRKFQKELNQVIRFWQFLVREQISPGQGKRGRFRQYKPEEIESMSKYISPEQLNTIEKQLESSYDLAPDSNLFDVEEFLMRVVSGLFNIFNEDLRIKDRFIDFERKKKIRNRQQKIKETDDILNSPGFVPNVKKCVAKIESVKRRKVFSAFMDYWEYLIDQKVPSSDKRKRKQVPKARLNISRSDALHYISVRQLEDILTNIDLIQKIRKAEERELLFAIGRPMIQIARMCAEIFTTPPNKKEHATLDKQRLKELTRYCQQSDLASSLNVAKSVQG